MEITLLIMENHGFVFLNFCGNPGQCDYGIGVILSDVDLLTVGE